MISAFGLTSERRTVMKRVAHGEPDILPRTPWGSQVEIDAGETGGNPSVSLFLGSSQYCPVKNQSKRES